MENIKWNKKQNQALLVLKLFLEREDRIELQATEHDIQHHFSLFLRKIH